MPTIFWAGDSTVKQNSILTYPQTGIGQIFNRYVKLGIQIENHAENGRSTKSFLDEGRLAVIYDRITEGDYLFIQFGHNDEKKTDPTRYTDPDSEFMDNLERFVNAARNKKALPVLITPVARRTYVEGFAQMHAYYSCAIRKVAQKLNVPLIDLYIASTALNDKLGPDKNIEFYMTLPAGVYPAFPEGKQDNTHLRPKGALVFGGLIAKALCDLGAPYESLIVDGFREKVEELSK